MMQRGKKGSAGECRAKKGGGYLKRTVSGLKKEKESARCQGGPTWVGKKGANHMTA